VIITKNREEIALEHVLAQFLLRLKGSRSGERNPSLKPLALAWARLQTKGTSIGIAQQNV